jgi:predicted GNAT family acetyltransferase
MSSPAESEADSPVDVVHVPDSSRFEVRDPAGTAVLTYELSDGAVTFVHTVVPVELEGRGIGSQLAGTAVGWARQEGLEVVPVCSFVKAWLSRHPDATAS